MAEVADFFDRFPEFCSEKDSRVQMFLDDAALLMSSPSRWLGFYDVAHLYLAAHLLTLAKASEMGDSNSIFPIKKQEVDDVVVEHAVAHHSVSPTSEDLYSTTYGKSYVRYRRIAFTGIYGV